jgi:two-component system, cell cycle sensor histidine kinase and response regulator CckA
VMPGVGGLEAFQALRRINPEVKVLLISGFSMEDDARQLLKAGARGYLQKPFRRYELAIAVARALKAGEPPASPGTP